MNNLGALVLVVEDETLIRMLAAEVLLDEGFVVLDAADAAEALEILADHPEVAVLFTDINMPGSMDGLQLANYVAGVRPEIKIVVTSGRHWLAAESLPRSGKFLPKPYRGAELTHIVLEQIGAPQA